MIIKNNMFNSSRLKSKIENELAGAIVSVTNPRQDYEHFLVNVIWKGFEGKSLLEQHRTINTILNEELKAGLHSISIKTRAN